MGRRTTQENAADWLKSQETTPRPGTIPPAPTLNLPADVLSPMIEWVSPADLRPNPRNDFDALAPDEYANLKDDIAKNGVLDALTARRDGVLVTGENRLRIAIELLAAGNAKVAKIPVRYYLRELSPAEEYDILEGDNLWRRQLTPQQRKVRIKARIKRHFAGELQADGRGGERSGSGRKRSEKASGKSKVHPELLKNEPAADRQKSKVQGELLKKESGDLASKVAKKERLPVGTAKRYLAEIRSESGVAKPKKKPAKSSKQPEAKVPPTGIADVFTGLNCLRCRCGPRTERGRKRRTCSDLASPLSGQVVSREVLCAYFAPRNGIDEETAKYAGAAVRKLYGPPVVLKQQTKKTGRKKR
jgi:ParB-like chromosome segregation protein Spo0J